MSAIRLARGFTGRAKIIKFAGCYHGHGDSLLAAAGSGVATSALPDSRSYSRNGRRHHRLAVQQLRSGAGGIRGNSDPDCLCDHRGDRPPTWALFRLLRIQRRARETLSRTARC